MMRRSPLVVLLLADGIEHGSWPNLEWDKVSAFQAWQLLVFIAFALLVRRVAARASGLGTRTFHARPERSIARIIHQLRSYCHHRNPWRAELGKA